MPERPSVTLCNACATKNPTSKHLQIYKKGQQQTKENISISARFFYSSSLEGKQSPREDFLFRSSVANYV